LNINPPRIILVDDNKDIVSILAGTFGLNGYEVHKAYAAEECLNKIKELEGIVDVIFVDGKIAADRAAMLIVNVKRINSKISIVVLAEDTPLGFFQWLFYLLFVCRFPRSPMLV